MPTTRSSTTDLVQANKALVQKWFALLSYGRVDEASSLCDPEGRIWAPRSRAESSLHDWFVAYRQLLDERFPDGLVFELGTMTAEDNRVCVLAEGNGTLPNGTEYNNLYHWFIEADGSRITGVREYADTHHAFLVFTSEGN